ncbi:MAG: Gfo/Idh/MocA family oxidoreductase, partial [Bacteroides sp.]|nr:Gfo/Idh/MocA family oxidoreductase [Bacteroides sp.]
NPILKSGQFELIGLCDVDSLALNSTAEKVLAAGAQKPKLFASYKEMYDLPGLQAVVIATPPHWHALQFVDACEKGLDVFLEKPLSWDIREGQAMLKAKQEAGTVVQVDFPRIMLDVNEQVKEYIGSGEAGRIMQVQAQIHYKESPLFEKEIPDTFDFETYCGPAPMQKYLCLEDAGTPRWRSQYVFSQGIMVDWGIHYLHNIRQVLDLGMPGSVSAIGGITSNYPRDNPDYLDVNFDFDGLPVYWSHKTWGYNYPEPKHRIGAFYYGEKANIFEGDSAWEIYPHGESEPLIHEAAQVTEDTFTQMMLEFAEGIRTRSNVGITNTFEEALITTAMVNYGDLAYRTEAAIDINASTFDVSNNDKAEAMLKREYRKPYKHPYA